MRFLRSYNIPQLDSFVDQILVSGGNFLVLAVCAHLLPLSEQGKFAYVFASYMALLLLNVSGIFQGAAVRAPAQDASYAVSLARLQLLQAILLSLLVSGLWFVCGNAFGWQATATECLLLFVFLAVQQLADFDRRAAYIFSSTRRAVYSSALLFPARIIGLLAFGPQTVGQVIWVLILSAIIPATLSLSVASRKSPGGSPSWVKTAWNHIVYSRMFIAAAPLGWLWAYIPIFLLGIMHGKEQAALLASIRGISNVANVLMEQMETKVVADWARLNHGDGGSSLEVAANRLLKFGLVFWLVGLVVAVVLGREIVAIVLGDPYAMHWELLMIGWVWYGVYFLVRVIGIKHRTLGANQLEFIGNACGVMAALIAGFLIIPPLNAAGAAWVYVIIAVAMLLCQMLILKFKR